MLIWWTFFAFKGGKTVERIQNGGNRILLVLLILIIGMSLSACTVGNDAENQSPAGTAVV